MSSPKVVGIFGATGLQGGSVVRSLRKDQSSSFQIRGITRNPASDASQVLESLGCQVVQADGWKVPEVAAAFEGVWAAFVNTNSDDPIFQHADGPTEFDLGKSIIDGLVVAGVRHLVLSALPSAFETTDGALSIRTMDMKHRIEQYAYSVNKFASITSLYAGWYYEILLDRGMAQVHGGFPFTPDDEGFYSLHMPRWGEDQGVPWISITHDFGDMVHGILLDPARWHQQSIQGVSEIWTLDDVTRFFSEVTGKPARYVPLASPDLLGPDIPALEDARLLFRLGQHTNGQYFGREASDTSRAQTLKNLALEAQGQPPSGLKSIRAWIQEHFSG